MKENTALISLLDEMGVIEGKDNDGEPVIAEQFLCRDPEERIFYKGRWYEGLYLHAGANPDDEQQMDKFNAEINRWVSWRDAKGRRAFTLPVSACSDDAEVTALDRISMGAWMDQHGLISPRLRWWVDYACRDDYGMTVNQTSAWAGLFYFCARVLKPGVESQSLDHMAGRKRPVGQPPFRKSSSHRYSSIAPRIDINPLSDRIEILTLDRDGRTPHGYRANRVIFAAPQFMARYVIRPYRENPPAHISEFQFGSWMVANLTLKDRPKPSSPRDFPLAWDNVLYESESLGYVVATHQRGIDRGPTVFTYYYPLCDENPRAAPHAAARNRLARLGRRGVNRPRRARTRTFAILSNAWT